MGNILDHISGPADLKQLSLTESKQLAAEIREFLLHHISKTGGHLSSNLGVVELTIALHQVFDTPTDQIVWDVGHQAYVHKILTGRRDRFDTLRQKDGLSGFPKMEESPYDAFNTGHATTSISAAYGIAKARDVLGKTYEVVAVIGDGSMTGGMAYEAMNNAGKDKTKLIIILNDNEMSISRNVGSMSSHLNRLRTRRSYLLGKRGIRRAAEKFPVLRPAYAAVNFVKNKAKYLFVKGILFEELGFTYLGPVDGHDIHDLTQVLQQAKAVNGPVVVHVKTVKGKGYTPAERNAARYHGVSAFEVETGDALCENQESWSDVLGEELTWMARRDPRVVAVTAAMPQGTGLDKLAKHMPQRLYDVGIAEEHAVTFAAGMAKAGLRPVVAIYSSFLQRSYDQILHDVCLPRLPVILAIDRSGVVGEDGETHQGIFDIAYLSHMPGLTIMAPSGKEELRDMLQFAYRLEKPVAIRYPKGAVPSRPEAAQAKIELGKSRVVCEGAQVAIVAVGCCLEEALKAARQMKQEGALPTVVDARFVAPIDEALLEKLLRTHSLLITIEDGVYRGGFGMQVAALANQIGAACSVRCLSFPNQFLAQDSRRHILEEYGISAEGIIKAWKEKNEQTFGS